MKIHINKQLALTYVERPKVGVGVIVRKDNKVLLSLRKNAHGQGSWSLAGGHLEYGETPQQCAQREVFEETGMHIANLKLGPYTNDVFETEQKHYLTIFVIADYKTGQLQNLEPDKCERWDWFSWDDLPQPLFIPIRNLLNTGFNPFKN